MTASKTPRPTKHDSACDRYTRGTVARCTCRFSAREKDWLELELTALRDELERFKSAEMPEYPTLLGDDGDMVGKFFYDELRAYCAKLKVEGERYKSAEMPEAPNWSDLHDSYGAGNLLVELRRHYECLAAYCAKLKAEGEQTRVHYEGAERDFKAAQKVIDELRARLAEAEKDAERYRWMKSHNGDWWGWARRKTGFADLDSAIDAARRGDAK